MRPRDSPSEQAASKCHARPHAAITHAHAPAIPPVPTSIPIPSVPSVPHRARIRSGRRGIHGLVPPLGLRAEDLLPPREVRLVLLLLGLAAALAVRDALVVRRARELVFELAAERAVVLFVRRR